MDTQFRPLNLPLYEPGGFVLIAGPCSAETEEQVMTTAGMLKDGGVTIFRASLWKPRTRPGCFEGVGALGLPWLQRVKSELGMLTATEVANGIHVDQSVDAGVDILWIGARTTSNPFLVEDIANAIVNHKRQPVVLVKNPINPDIDLWAGAIERLKAAGVEKIGAIHRGFSTYADSLYRNPPHWQIPIELMRRYPSLPMLGDPSHITGKRSLVPEICRQAIDMHYAGLIVESHCTPDSALSDAAQQLTPKELLAVTSKLRLSELATCPLPPLDAWRTELDQLDENILGLLSKRMKISELIGHYKKDHNLSVLQTVRYQVMQEELQSKAENLGLDTTFIHKLFAQIHEESVRLQHKICDEE